MAAPAENVVLPRPKTAAVGHCTRRVRTLDASDTLGKAANVLRLTAVPVVPVVRNGEIVGLMSQSRLSLSNGSTESTKVEQVMLPPPAPLSASMDAADGLAIMEASGLDVAPVVTGRGNLAGVVTRSDLVSLASGALRPKRCGGMATPLGVYLTTGAVRAGASDFGLFLAGVVMALYALLSLGVVFAAVWFVDERWAVGITSAFGMLPASGWASAWTLVVLLAWLGLYALLFRGSMLAGYHAAEHMTVNAIEAGDDVAEDQVAEHSRVHPRCGTNLVVVLLVFSVVGELGGLSGVWLGILALVVVLGRCTIGGLAQRYITTRPPTPDELASGVRAGRDLIERHQGAIGQPTPFLRRIWCMGILQAMAGLLFTYWLVSTVAGWLGVGELLALIP
jgi:CBS domain-containing protein